MAPAYLLSLLVRQRLKLKDEFGTRYPGAWLVWEPGTWTAPTEAHEETVRPLSSTAHPDRPPRGDSLCFELVAQQSPLTIGRAPGSGILLNDATISREHARLVAAGGGWTVEAIASTGTALSGREIGPGPTWPLRSGDELILGGLRLTHHDGAGMIARLIKAWE